MIGEQVLQIGDGPLKALHANIDLPGRELLKAKGVLQQALGQPVARHTGGQAVGVTSRDEVWNGHGAGKWGIYPPSSMGDTYPSAIPSRGGNIPHMSELNRAALEQALEAKSLSARALSLRVGTNAYLVRDILNGNSQNPRADTIAKLAEELEIPVSALLQGASNDWETAHQRAEGPPTVPLLGLARANPDGSYVMTTANESHARVPLVPGATSAAVALQVAGGSMHTKARDGSLIYFDNQEPAPPSYLIGEACVVETEDGRVLYKYLQRGSQPGLYDLVSDVGEIISDVRLNWVAEVLVIVPPRHAQRILARGNIEAA
jgi:transcriptional regulator with XRE-family HTH domain